MRISELKLSAVLMSAGLRDKKNHYQKKSGQPHRTTCIKTFISLNQSSCISLPFGHRNFSIHKKLFF
jgi:hypothetical protein